MIYKRCSICGKRVEEGKTCPCRKTEEKYKRKYSAPEGTRKLYHTYRWQQLKSAVMAMYSGLDQWSMSEGRMEPAEVLHHIIPAEEAPELFWSVSNLIPLSRASHDAVHGLYRRSEADRSAAVERLRAMIRTPGADPQGGSKKF